MPYTPVFELVTPDKVLGERLIDKSVDASRKLRDGSINKRLLGISVGASYLRAERITTAQTISNSSGTDVVYNSIIQEDDAGGHFSLNTSTGVVTCNTTGWYSVVAEVLWEGNATGRRLITIQHSTTGEVGGTENGGHGTGQWRQQIVGLFPATAADTFTIEVFQTSGGNLDIEFGVFTSLGVIFSP